MTTYSTEQLQTIVEKFSDKSLPKEAWTHQAHLIIALWYNSKFEFESAFQQVKSHIITYNKCVGTPNTTSSGYHETLTRFWMMVTKKYLLENRADSFEKVCNEFLESEYASKNLPLEFYSRKELFSVHARMNWVEGDLKTIVLRKS